MIRLSPYEPPDEDTNRVDELYKSKGSLLFSQSNLVINNESLNCNANLSNDLSNDLNCLLMFIRCHPNRDDCARKIAAIYLGMNDSYGYILWVIYAKQIAGEYPADPFVTPIVSKYRYEPVNAEDWKNVPCIHGHMPTPQDLLEGRAVFFAIGNSKDFKSLDIPIPSCAIINDIKLGVRSPAIVIQGIETPQVKLVGYRLFKGGSGYCSLSEVNITECATFSELI